MNTRHWLHADTLHGQLSPSAVSPDLAKEYAWVIIIFLTYCFAILEHGVHLHIV